MNRRNLLVIVLCLAVIFLTAACSSPTPTATQLPTATMPPTETPRPTNTPTSTPMVDLTDTSILGTVELVQYVLRGKPGEEFEDVLVLTTDNGTEQVAFPGYICGTEENSYGIGAVSTGSGGLNPNENNTQTYGIKIWEDSKSGDSCVGVVKIWLYKGNMKYELSLPVMIIVE